MKPWRETYPGACSSRQTVGGRVLRRAVREGRPRFLWGGSSPVWCRYSHATYTKESHHSPPPPVHLINREPSLSPGRGKEESDGVSAPPQLHSLAPCSADCSVLHLCPSRLLCCGPRRSAKQTHSPAIWAKQQQQRHVCNQWWCNSRKATQVELQQLLVLVVQLQQTDTADYREVAVCPIQPALAVPPAMGAFACPGTFQ